MSEHTPGPWKMHDEDYCPEEIYGDFEGPMEDGKIRGTLVCTVAGEFDESPIPEKNARLILAAPELLAALIACEDRLVREGTAKAWPEIEAARAAIYKAKGELS
jgi:hypothetical protein